MKNREEANICITVMADKLSEAFSPISIILYFLQTVNPNNTFAARIKASLAKYPQINVSVMGYWEKNSLWE